MVVLPHNGFAIDKFTVLAHIKKLKEHARKNGFIAMSSEHVIDAYTGTKNWTTQETELAYELTYAAASPLHLTCRSCKTKDILPVDLAYCRAEFVKVFTAVTGKRPDFNVVPHMLTPQAESETTTKRFGKDERFVAKVIPIKCVNKDNIGYSYSISDLKSVAE